MPGKIRQINVILALDFFPRENLLEFLSFYFDQTILANCVTTMLISLGPIFWQRKTKNDWTGARTTDHQIVRLTCYRYTNKEAYLFKVKSIAKCLVLPKNWSQRYQHGRNTISKNSYVKNW